MKVRLYIKQFLEVGAEITLESEDCHYIKTVLKLKANDTVFAFNSQEGEFLTKVCLKKSDIYLKVVEFVKAVEGQPKQVHLFFANIKNNLVGDILNSCTQVGVTNFTPIITKHTVNHHFSVVRGQKIIKEACEQSGRILLPELSDIINFKKALESVANFPIILFCDENSAGKLSQIKTEGHSKIAIFVGPEGGFSEEERNQLAELKGAITISLGSFILKAETACVCASFLAVSKLA